MSRNSTALLAFLAFAISVAAQEHGVKVPPGFKVTLYADHTLANDIYSMTLDNQGYVLVSGRGWVKLLEDTDGDGKADKATTIYETKTGSMGLCWENGRLYTCGDGGLSKVAFPSAFDARFAPDDLFALFLDTRPKVFGRPPMGLANNGRNGLAFQVMATRRQPQKPWDDGVYFSGNNGWYARFASPPEPWENCLYVFTRPNGYWELPREIPQPVERPKTGPTYTTLYPPYRETAPPHLVESDGRPKRNLPEWTPPSAGFESPPPGYADRWLQRWFADAVAMVTAPVPQPKTTKILPLAFGEHGGHAMRLGPDGCWYVIAGNDAALRNVLLDRASPIKKPEAGGMLRISRDLETIECVAQGFRNPYRFDFTPFGDIITFDSDTERDFLFPWYSPTRMYHVAHAQHHGWRVSGYTKSLARRDYYADTVDMLAPMGRGSPTGVVCYRHHQFPRRYHGGVFALDWTFGKIWFLPLNLEDSSYETTPEMFLEPTGVEGFAPTDACVAPDGSLFVCIGGRGTRGAVYRIEYVGTKDEPRGRYIEPFSDLGKVLDAPQPLDAWSRARWSPLAQDLGPRRIVVAAMDGPIERRIRAIEVATEMSNINFFTIQLGDFKQILKSLPPAPVRARLAWSLGRVFPDDSELLLLDLAGDSDGRVRVAALDALADVIKRKEIVEFGQKHFRGDAPRKLVGIILDNFGHTDKRVRLAATRLVALLPPPSRKELAAALENAPLGARLTAALSDNRHGSVDRFYVFLEEQKLALEALRGKDAQGRLDALRLLMLFDGDWRLDLPPDDVYATYSLQTPHEKVSYNYLDRYIPEQIRKLYPTGDKRFDHEAARYLAMIEDDDPKTVEKIVGQFTKESAASDDIHHLIVLSRLKGKATAEQTRVVIDALFGLDKKLAGQQMRVKQNWGPRLGQVVFNLTLRFPDMTDVLLKHADFVHPTHVAYAGPFTTKDGITAAQLFRDAVRKDANFEWSAELVELLATLPPAEYRPLFRKQWSDYSLRDAMLAHLTVNPDEADHARFLDGLDSFQQAIALKCATALRSLPRDESAKNLVPIVRRLRAMVRATEWRSSLSDKLIELLNYQAGASFAPNQPPQALLWFEKAYPAEAKLLRGDDEDAESWQKTLASVKWDKGNAERGLKLFRERSCQACHSGSSRIGPDLVGAAGRFSRDDLFASIIWPSRDVAPAYRVTEIETRDGKSFAGLVVFESADGLIVQIDAAKTVRIDSGNIASRQPGRKSLMPSGLLKDLKPEDLADLYSYLRSLK